MKARAPGKLVLTGAYAVLEGAPAIVAAVDRYAVADASREAEQPAREVIEALEGGDSAPAVDVSSLYDGAGRKLGLGSSAAAVVASLAAIALSRGADVEARDVRDRLFATARAAHGRAQGGGSGVDVAASVYGGLLSYRLEGQRAVVRPAAIPSGLTLAVFFSGASARTQDLLDHVARATATNASEVRPVRSAMAGVASEADDAVRASDVAAFVRCARAYGDLLSTLGRLTGAPIVPPACAELARGAEKEGGAFLPSGAGGGDVSVWIGVRPPSPSFVEAARAFALAPLTVSIDTGGVRSAPPSARGA